MKSQRKNSERITKIKLFIDKYNWDGINYPSETEDWKKTKKNNLTIALNVFYAKKKRSYILSTFQDKTHSVKNKLFV